MSRPVGWLSQGRVFLFQFAELQCNDLESRADRSKDRSGVWLRYFVVKPRLFEFTLRELTPVSHVGFEVERDGGDIPRFAGSADLVAIGYRV